MKHLTAILLCFGLAAQIISYQTVSAADDYRVSADTSQMECLEQDIYLIPVMLYGNNGIMGFHITFSYDVAELDILTMSRGVVTSVGNFDTNLSESKTSGKTDLIWCHTEDRKMDGSICYLTVKMIAKNPSFTITYSPPDTFNERYQDIKLSCEKIEIDNTIHNDVAKQNYTSQSSKSENKTKTEWTQRENAVNEFKAVQSDFNLSEEDVKEAYFHSLAKHEMKKAKGLSKKKQELLCKETKDYLIQYKGVTEENIKETDIQTQIDRLVITEGEYEDWKKENTSYGRKLSLWIEVIGGITIVSILSFIVIVRIRRKKDGEVR